MRPREGGEQLRGHGAIDGGGLRRPRARPRPRPPDDQLSTTASHAPAARTVAVSSMRIETPIARSASRVECHAAGCRPSPPAFLHVDAERKADEEAHDRDHEEADDGQHHAGDDGSAGDARVAQAPSGHEHLHDLGATDGQRREGQHRPARCRRRRRSIRSMRARRRRRGPARTRSWCIGRIRSSQRSIERSCDGREATGGGSGWRPAMRSPGVRRSGSWSIVSGSGRRSRAGCRARMLRCRPACRRRSASGGFGRVAGCRPSRCPRRRGGTCRLPSGRRSPRSARPRRRGQGDRASARPLAVNDLQGAASQRHPRRRAGVPGHDRPVARRACRRGAPSPRSSP